MVIAVFALLAVGGCSMPEHYYYQAGKSLEQAKDDWQQCYSDVMDYVGGGYKYELFSRYEDRARECMRSQGYRLKAESQLGKEVRTEKGVIGGEAYWLAGE